MPTLTHEIGQLLFFKFGRDVPEIVYDGNPDPQFIDENGNIVDNRGFCIGNNEDAEFLNLDINNNFTKWYTPFITKFSQEKSAFTCELPSLSQTEIIK